MARYRGSVCRLCRREGIKLYLKGSRCETEKCAIEKRAYPPGQHGQERSKFSEYGVQLREKQKVRRTYGVLEKQFRGYYKEAARLKGATGENLLQLLECRLDNVVYRLGLLSSRNEARQYVNHGHILVNEKKVTIPSYVVSIDDTISIREKSKENNRIKSSVESVARRGVPEWLDLDSEKLTGNVKRLPIREDFTLPLDEQLIIEFYSKL